MLKEAGVDGGGWSEVHLSQRPQAETGPQGLAGLDGTIEWHQSIICYPDFDGDSLGDVTDSGSYFLVSCGDGFVTNNSDNCPNLYNPDQADLDEDGIGDTCDPLCCRFRGDVDHSGPGIDMSDMFYLIDYMFTFGPPAVCSGGADINGDGAEMPDIGDLVYLIDYMFRAGPEPPACP